MNGTNSLFLYYFIYNYIKKQTSHSYAHVQHFRFFCNNTFQKNDQSHVLSIKLMTLWVSFMKRSFGGIFNLFWDR